MPMPASATASTRPKVKTDPPSSGASRRYQTSSIRKNAKPTVAPTRARQAGTAGAGARRCRDGAGRAGPGSGAHRRAASSRARLGPRCRRDRSPVHRASDHRRTRRRLTAAASQIVARVPKTLEQQERRDDAADDGAERVERVERGDVLPAHVGRRASRRARRPAACRPSPSSARRARARSARRARWWRSPCRARRSAAGEIEIADASSSSSGRRRRGHRDDQLRAARRRASGRGCRSARGPSSRPPTPRPPMKIASTAAEAAVEAPKISRNSRSQPTW